MQFNRKHEHMSGAAAGVLRLLDAYGDLLHELDTRRDFLAVRSRRRGAPFRPTRIVARLLRSQISRHVNRVLLGAETALRRRSAREISGAGEAEILVRVEHLRKSLQAGANTSQGPAGLKYIIPWVLPIITAILGILGVTKGREVTSTAIANEIANVCKNLANSFMHYYQDAYYVDGSLHPHSHKFEFSGILSTSLLIILLSALLISMCALPLARAFRFKRILLNVHPDPTKRIMSGFRKVVHCSSRGDLSTGARRF